MKILKDPVFEPETTSDRIANIFANILTFIFVVLIIVAIISVITIIGVEIASAVWGDYTVIYWLAELF
jgi:TM2 domain-containing membrane protein YozV